MGKRDGSGSSNQAGSPRVAGEKKPRAKRSRSGAAEYARELNKNDNSSQLDRLKGYLFETIRFKESATYRIFYSNGREAIVEFKDGKVAVVTSPDVPGKKFKKFGMNGIEYISKATKSKFVDSLGFETGKGNERAEKIYAKEKKFNTYNEEVRRLFKKKKRKSSSKKKSPSKKKE